ncbi:MAG: class I mannose-6-phosphate isomerase [Bacteroidales bacterium]|nr:class I mannose-6-phosphate isomerase [Bacteroidales bacterium]
MKKLYPLKFRPEWKPKAWGGEWWDLCDFENEISVVSNGFLADNDLADILETYMGDLVGDEQFDYHNLYFPLLIKRLVVDQRLSVQVHPDDETAGERYGLFGKTEFWLVTEAGPDARIWMGFKEDTDAGTLYRACQDGTAQNLMNEYIPKPGDCFFIPTGTVHAAGGGLKIAEIQETSDTTFRLYDWGREHNPATRRQMHLDEALDCINYKKYDEAAFSGHLKGDDQVRVLVECGHFVITSLPLRSPARVRMDEFKSFIIYNCITGSAKVKCAGEEYPLTAGEIMLVPASVEEVVLVPGPEGAHLLQTHMPAPPKDDVYDGPEL